MELKYWAKHNLPYVDSLQKKLRNTEMFAIVKSSIKTGSSVPQTCRTNAIFVIDTQRLKDLYNVKSDLNGTFQVFRSQMEDSGGRGQRVCFSENNFK